MESETAAPEFTIEQVDGEDKHGVRGALDSWARYVNTALAENPVGEVLWQLESAKKVLKSIRSNLAEFLEEDDDDHDFDIARSSRGIEAVIDTTRDGSFTIENLVTNPVNLYTLAGQTDRQVRGSGSALIKSIVELAVEKGDKKVKIVALTPEHVERYRRMGFDLDEKEMETDSEDVLQVSDEEIPMVAPIESLKSHFGIED